MVIKMRTYLRALFWGLLAALIFIGVGISYVSSEKKAAQNETESVPYYSAYPESKGVLFDFLGDKTLLYFDFEGKSLSVVYPDEISEENKIYGYPIDFRVSADYSLLEYIIDAVGGIVLKIGEETLSLTGVQVSNILETNTEREELRREIAEQIILKISKQGFDRENVLYIIENSKTDLTVPDCYYWSEHLKEVCQLPRMVN